MKKILGDYGSPHTAAIQWGCDHKTDAICSYARKTQMAVRECGILIKFFFPTSLDGIISLDDTVLAWLKLSAHLSTGRALLKKPVVMRLLFDQH